MRRLPSCFDCFESQLLFQFDPDDGADSEHVDLLASVIA